MECLEHEFQIYIIDDVSECWEDLEARNLFNDVVSLKLAGYRGRYQNSVLPVGSDDFIGRHIVVALKNVGARPTVLLAYKSVLLDHYKKYNLHFSLLSFLEQSSRHLMSAVESFLEDNKNKNIAFNLGLTINPLLDKYLELKWQTLDIFNMLALANLRDQTCDHAFMIANKHFNTLKTFKKLGVDQFRYNYEASNVFTMPSFDNQEAELMLYSQANYHNKFAEQKLTEYQKLWQERVTFNGTSKKSQIESLSLRRQEI